MKGIVTAATAQGPRFHQEDRYLVDPFSFGEGLSGYLLAVMDGHGGSDVADLCEDRIPDFFSLSGPEDLEDALRRVIAKLDELTRGLRSGSTLSIACVLESHGKASVGVLGDSPVIAVDRDGDIVTSPEHNVRSNLAERRRAESRGGMYEGGYIVNPRTGAGLQMARALGDWSLGDILSRDPDLYTVEIGPNSVIVLATDGLLDPGHWEKDRLVTEMMDLRELGSGLSARVLLDWAMRRGLEDNATAIVWKGSE